MSVSAVSSSTVSTAQLPAASSQSLAQLQKDIVAVQKQIATESKSSDDSKTKAQVIQALQAELQALQMAMQQKMAQQAQAQKAATASTQNSSPAAKADVDNSSPTAKAGVDDGVGVNLDTQA
jgi:predicted  nucleic acid-binding Zn-ribbon protein